MKVGVIILNYMAYQATMNCMDSFSSQENEFCEIKYVIVDNCSTNNSYAILKEKYENRDDVFVVSTDKNIGFAKGNNYGYKILKQYFQPDFVIFSNDDILLSQVNLYGWIRKSYEKYSFAVLGPQVYSINGKFHQSPMENCTRNTLVCHWWILKYLLKIVRAFIVFKILQKKKAGYSTWKNEIYSVFSDNKTIHGSFMIFSQKYFEYFSEPFDSHTYLYMEEDIVKLRCDLSNIRMVFSPEYRVEHLQSVSTNMINDSLYQKQLFYYVNHIKSLKVYQMVLRELLR
ncbi:MAG: glycosyltransferase family 2 protein [Lachnospiraceae bacterium]|nr:glycosyltransferase family 2 protein [Lachnospiraceae bacterium]